MFGEETLFERQLKDFQEIESDPNKNVDEVQEEKTDEAKSKDDTQKSEKPKELKIKGDGDTGKLQKLEGKTNEEEDLAGKFGVFGYDEKDENVYCQHFDTEEAAREDALSLAEELGDPSKTDKPLAYIEIWKANEKGEFGHVEGSDLLWHKEYSTEESKTNEEVKEDTGSDLLAIANTKLGWAVAEQLKSILENPTKEGIDDAELNSNAVRMIYKFLYRRDDELSQEARRAIEDWVEEGWGDPDVLGEFEPRESKTNEEETEENKVDTVSNDPSFERTVEKFAQVEEDENKNVDEKGIPATGTEHIQDGYWYDKEGNRVKVTDSTTDLLTVKPEKGKSEKILFKDFLDKYDRVEESKTNEEEVKESYGNVYIAADIEKGLSKEEIIRKIQDRYPHIADEQAEEIYDGVVSDKGGGWPKRPKD